MKHARLYRGDAVIIAVLFALCAALALLSIQKDSSVDERIIVTVDGKPYRVYSLTETVEETIGSTGVRLVIQNGHAYIAASPCPDKTCIHSGTLSADTPGKSLVCLPCRVAITLEATMDSYQEVDTLVG